MFHNTQFRDLLKMSLDCETDFVFSVSLPPFHLSEIIIITQIIIIIMAFIGNISTELLFIYQLKNSNQIKRWLMRRGENWSTQRKKPLMQSKESPNSTHIWSWVWEPRPHWWDARVNARVFESWKDWIPPKRHSRESFVWFHTLPFPTGRFK